MFKADINFQSTPTLAKSDLFNFIEGLEDKTFLMDSIEFNFSNSVSFIRLILFKILSNFWSDSKSFKIKFLNKSFVHKVSTIDAYFL